MDRTAELCGGVGRDNRFMTSYEAYNWLCLGNDREAEAVAGEYPGERLNGHVLVLAALGRPAACDARAALERFAGFRTAWHFRVEAAPLTFALDPARPTSDVRRLIREAGGMSPPALEERKRRLAYLDGTLSDSDLLAAPSGGVSDTAGRYYQIAWKRLGAGDRDGARKAFEEVYRSKLIDSHVWRIARAILIRMKDPKWPQALLGTK